MYSGSKRGIDLFFRQNLAESASKEYSRKPASVGIWNDAAECIAKPKVETKWVIRWGA